MPSCKILFIRIQSEIDKLYHTIHLTFRLPLSVHRKTRDGKQRFVVPRPLGTPFFINDASLEELKSVLKTHKDLVKQKYGSGVGIG